MQDTTLQPIIGSPASNRNFVRCGWCFAVRDVGKGFTRLDALKCFRCDTYRRHEWIFNADLGERIDQLIILLDRTGGVGISNDPLVATWKNAPASFKVARRDTWFFVTLNRDLSPWGLSSALHRAWIEIGSWVRGDGTWSWAAEGDDLKQVDGWSALALADSSAVKQLTS